MQVQGWAGKEWYTLLCHCCMRCFWAIFLFLILGHGVVTLSPSRLTSLRLSYIFCPLEQQPPIQNPIIYRHQTWNRRLKSARVAKTSPAKSPRDVCGIWGVFKGGIGPPEPPLPHRAHKWTKDAFQDIQKKKQARFFGEEEEEDIRLWFERGNQKIRSKEVWEEKKIRMCVFCVSGSFLHISLCHYHHHYPPTTAAATPNRRRRKTKIEVFWTSEKESENA